MRILRLLMFFVVIAGLNIINSNSQNTIVNKSEQLDEKVTSVHYNSSTSELVIINPYDGNYLIQIFNLTGTEILKREILKSSSPRIPTTNLKNGVYLVRITPVLSQPSATFKIMIR